jgi:hypothetical protein
MVRGCILSSLTSSLLFIAEGIGGGSIFSVALKPSRRNKRNLRRRKAQGLEKELLRDQRFVIGSRKVLA